jgi:hypothetical protein
VAPPLRLAVTTLLAAKAVPVKTQIAAARTEKLRRNAKVFMGEKSGISWR